MIHLSEGSTLQNGKYRIVKALGTGGFGITYLATQVSLGRNVAIKEFFMKEYCDRDGSTSRVSVPTENSKIIVESYKQKFIKEAQTIASLNNSHIVRIYDIFEENDTAYYVMEYHDNGSLLDLVKQKGPLSEKDAISYVKQIGDALSYLHKKKILHLDIKPSNVLLNDDGDVVLIDFGISKHYDSEGGQTSTTPVGISKGYAPMEQYQQGSITKFSPATDVYSLGATFYFLLTGQTPPEATDIYEEGLPVITTIDANTMSAINSAMTPRRKDRPQSIEAFLSILEGRRSESTNEESTIIINKNNTRLKESEEIDESTIIREENKKKNRTPEKGDEGRKGDSKKHKNKYLWLSFLTIFLLTFLFFFLKNKPSNPNTVTVHTSESPSFHIYGSENSVLPLSFDAEGGSILINFKKNFEEDWIYSEKPAWIKIHTGASSFTVICEKNTSTYTRTASINIFKKGTTNTLAAVEITQRSIGINKTGISIKEGETFHLSISGFNGTITWKSENPSVASVDKNGLVKGNKPGVTVVLARCGSVDQQCRVVVEERNTQQEKVSQEYKQSSNAEIDISTSYKSIMEGDSFRLYITGYNGKIVWESTNPSVARVDNNGWVVGASDGYTYIVARFGSETRRCLVNVNKKAQSQGKKQSSGTEYKLSEIILEIKTGETHRLTVLGYSGHVTWKSDNPSVAKVDGNGYVTGVSSGKTLIWAVFGAYERNCSVTVKETKQNSYNYSSSSSYSSSSGSNTDGKMTSLNRKEASLAIGSTLQLSTIPANIKVKRWESDNPKVATVDGNGRVYAVGEGQTNVWAHSELSSKRCAITVHK